MALLFVLAIVVVIFALERLLFFRRYNIDASIFIEGIRNLVQQDKTSEAIDLCEREGSPAACIVRTALLDKNLPHDELKSHIKSTALLEIPRCERHIVPILTIAKITPNIGLIGVVISFYSAFKALQETGLNYANSALFSDAVTNGMLLIVVSLIINIFSNFTYNFLYGKVRSIVYQLEWTYNECLKMIFSEKN